MAATFVNDSDSAPIVAGEALTKGDLVAIGADGKAYQANAATGSEMLPAMFVAETTVAANAVAELKHSGKVAGCTGLTPGSYVYVGNTAGAYSASAGNTSQKVGLALSATEWVMEFEQVAVAHTAHS